MAHLVMDNEMATVECISYYVSAIGSVTSILITIIVVSQISHYVYTMAFKSVENANSINKYTHCLAILYFVSNILTLLCLAFIRGNIWTNISVHKYTKTQCEIGFYGTYTFLLINKTFVWILFLSRIKILFQHSMYQYSSTTLHALMGFIVFTFIGELVFLYAVEATQWVLHYNENGIVYCKRNDDYHPVIIVGKAYVVISDNIFCFIFIYMFVSKLKLLAKQLVVQYVTQHPLKYLEKAQSLSQTKDSKHNAKSKSMNLPYVPSKVLNAPSSVEHNEMTSRRDVHNLTVDQLDVISKDAFTMQVIASNYDDALSYGERNEIHDILQLQQLMMKQTILVSVTMGSSLIFLIISGLMPGSLQHIWIDIVLNTVCVWLMFACASAYWDKLVSICCCCCCYTKLSRSPPLKQKQVSNKEDASMS
eukprot:176423_1